MAAVSIVFCVSWDCVKTKNSCFEFKIMLTCVAYIQCNELKLNFKRVRDCTCFNLPLVVSKCLVTELCGLGVLLFSNKALTTVSTQNTMLYCRVLHTIQYTTLHNNTIQYNTLHYNTIQNNTIQCNAI